MFMCKYLYTLPGTWSYVFECICWIIFISECMMGHSYVSFRKFFLLSKEDRTSFIVPDGNGHNNFLELMNLTGLNELNWAHFLVYTILIVSCVSTFTYPVLYQCTGKYCSCQKNNSPEKLMMCLICDMKIRLNGYLTG